MAKKTVSFKPNAMGINIVSSDLDRTDNIFNEPVLLSGNEVLLKIGTTKGSVYIFPWCNIHRVSFVPIK